MVQNTTKTLETKQGINKNKKPTIATTKKYYTILQNKKQYAAWGCIFFNCSLRRRKSPRTARNRRPRQKQEDP